MTVALADPLRRIASLPAVVRAQAAIHSTDEATLSDQKTIAGIAAPPFGESRRALWLADRFESIGLQNVETDAVGNVMAVQPGESTDAAPIVVAAHLDTVFPAETAIEVREEQGRWLAPGIADNARGLAGMLAVARAVAGQDVIARRSIVFTATVGEEGIGDLRGVKHLFGADSVLRNAAGFVALDGAECRRIVCRAVGSIRFRIVMRGSGGHSWADRGTPNAAHALGRAIAGIGSLRVSTTQGWSANVGRIGGGTSVNAIPEEAWCELDLRAEEPAVLDRLVADVTEIVHSSARDAGLHRRRGSSPIRADLVQIGLRPAGETPPDTTIVKAARAATAYIGLRPELVASSTDANVPMSLGIPSISIGCGGESGGMHTLGEWYENTRGPDGIVRALLTIVATAAAPD